MKKLFLTLILIVPFAAAQDFGYEYSMISEYRAAGAGYHLHTFAPSSSNPLTDSAKIDFSTAMPMLEFRQNNGRLAIGYQSYKDLNGNSKEAFSVYGESHSDFSLNSSKRSGGSWFIPVVVSANYVRAQAPQKVQEDFDVGSLGLGSGIKFKHFNRSFGIQAFAVGSLYYASEGFSTDYGTQMSVHGEVQVIIPDLIYEGMIFSYRYEGQEWDMNNNGLDYRRIYHGAAVGILF